MEEVTKEGSYCILDVLQEHWDTWKQKHWAGTEDPGQSGSKDDDEYEIPKTPTVEFVKKLASKYKTQTTQVRGLRPRQLQGLSDQAPECLISFWQ